VQFGTLQFGIAAHEFVKRPLPFPGVPSHICRKPDQTSATHLRCPVEECQRGQWKTQWRYWIRAFARDPRKSARLCGQDRAPTWFGARSDAKALLDLRDRALGRIGRL